MGLLDGAANPAGAAAGGLQAVLGGIQALTSGVKQKNQNLLNYANGYNLNPSISDLYNKALANYSPNDYQSKSYLNDTNTIGTNLQTGIDASQTRQGGIGSLTSMVASADDQDAKAASRAEGVGRQTFNQLQGATSMKAADDKYKYELKYNLLAAQAAAAAKQKSQGLQNLYGGLSSVAVSSMKDTS